MRAADYGTPEARARKARRAKQLREIKRKNEAAMNELKSSCPHNNVNEYFQKCDDCGAELLFRDTDSDE